MFFHGLKKAIFLLLPIRCVTCFAAVRYVSSGGAHVAPFTNWVDAAKDIQSAVDVSSPGDFIWVTNGVYNTGGVVVSPGTITNRIAITNNITVQSVNGSEVTSIEGSGPWGGAATRCAYVESGSQLVGFTLTNGYTALSGVNNSEGGGAYSPGSGLLISCRIVNCRAINGGGVYSGQVSSCYLGNNFSSNFGGGAYGTLIISSTSAYNFARNGGGGAYLSFCTNSIFQGNVVRLNGGGLFMGEAYNCNFYNNRSTNSGNGGGVCSGLVFNCNFVSNSALRGGGGSGGQYVSCLFYENFALRGGGVYSETNQIIYNYISNCVFDGNMAITNSLYVYGTNATPSGGAVHYCNVYNSKFRKNYSGNNGGAALRSSLSRCILEYNTAMQNGGGTYGSKVTYSIIAHNYAQNKGGGAAGGEVAGNAYSYLLNCTIISNTAANLGSGIYNRYATNSLIYYNDTANYADDGSGVVVTDYLSHCFTTPLPSFGVGNVDGDPPTFVSRPEGDYYIDSTWTNFDKGISLGATEDLGGQPIIDGDGDGIAEVDFGARESYSALVDTDSDGLFDSDEVYTHSTDPQNPDTDGGGMSDGCEVDYSPAFDPHNPADDIGDLDGDRYTNIEECNAGTHPGDATSHPNTTTVIALLSAEQTSSGGEGFVTVSNTVYDFDDDIAQLEILFSTDDGASWTNAWIYSASATYGTVSISNYNNHQILGLISTTNGIEQLTNTLTFVWETTNGPLPILISTGTLVRLRAWDGMEYGNAVTSQPFLVDNQAPVGLGDLTSSTHATSVTSTNNTIAISWAAATDGTGIGLAGYSYAITDGIGSPPTYVVTTSTNGSIDSLENGTNYYIVLTALDNYGNAAEVINLGPFIIDTNAVVASDLNPPDNSTAFIVIQTSELGSYVVGSSISGSWGGFTDDTAIAGYYIDLADNGGTTNGTFTTETNGSLSGVVFNQTNTFYVWAVDISTNIGLAVSASVYVLDPNDDPDADKYTSLEEEVIGTSATNSASVFQQTIQLISNQVSVAWTFATNRTYILYQTPDQILQTPLAVTTNPPFTTTSGLASWIQTNGIVSSGTTNQNFWIGVIKQ